MKKLLTSLLLGLMLVGNVFAQGKSLDATTGFYIYLKGSEVEISELEELNYAKAEEYNVYSKYHNDEFEWEEQFSKLKENFKNKIKNADMTSEYAIITTAEFGDYDFKTEGFPVKIEDGTFFPIGKVGNYNNDYDSIFRKTVALSLDDFSSYNFFKMPKAEAKTFLQSKKSKYGTVDRNIKLLIKYKIADYNSAEYKKFANLALNNDYLPVVGIINSIEVYDKNTNKKISELIKQ